MVMKLVMIRDNTANKLQEYPRLKILGKKQQKQNTENLKEYLLVVNFKNY